MNILNKIVEHKKQEINNLKIAVKAKFFEERNFLKAISKKDDLSLIAEIKRKSPSVSKIFQGTFEPAKIAKAFEESGVSAISVLTDSKFFGGSFKYLSDVKKNTIKTPILAKDFFISKKQIDIAKNAGADAILLIAKILHLSQLKNFLEYAHSKNLHVVVEIVDEKDLKKVLKTNAKIIGINNRNLENFKIDLANTYSLVKKIPQDKVIISMSGFLGADVQLVKMIVDAVLVGTSISSAKNIPQKIQEFLKPKPLLKICGIREIKTAEFCEKNNVNLVGLNFVPSSKRNILYDKSECSQLSISKKNTNLSEICQNIHSCKTLKKAKEIREKFIKSKVVGVFQNQKCDFVNFIAKELKLDFVQLHGDESIAYCKKISRPIIKSISISCENDFQKIALYEKHVDIFLFDNKIGGSGKTFNHNILFKKLSTIKKPFFIAGGIDTKNAKDVISRFHPIGIDTASGVEKDGKIDCKKILEFINIVNK